MRRAMPFLAIGLCLVVALGWYFVWYSPAGDTVAATRAQADVVDAQAQQLEVKVASLRKVADQAPALVARAAQLSARIPNETSLDGFILEANRIAAAHGIEWVSVAPQLLAGGGPGGVGVIPFSAEVTGSYEQIRTYLEALMNGERLVVLDGVTITASSNDDADTAAAASLQVSVDGRMFTRALPEGYVDPNAPTTTPPTGGTSSSNANTATSNTTTSNTAARTGAS